MASAISAGSSSGSTILRALGVDAIWLSPIFPSPMADFGYDISDYYRHPSALRHPRPISMRSWARPHSADLKVILDFVPNHTSDQHPWFIESRARATIPSVTGIIWRAPAPDGGPPNNWLSELRRQRLAIRRDERPVLLPRLPRRSSPISTGAIRQVRAAMHDVMRFWLRSRRRRLSRRRALASDQGRGVSRQSAQSRLSRPGEPPHDSLLPLYTDRSAGGAGRRSPACASVAR